MTQSIQLNIPAYYYASVESELRDIILSNPSAISSIMSYHLGWSHENGTSRNGSSGKKLRSTLCLLCCEAYGGNPDQVLPVAAAIELIHSFTLIHDDIEDQGEQRHHRPTVWKLWGTPQAINVGDGMFALAQLAALKLAKRVRPKKKILKCLDAINRACFLLCEGQYMDIAFEAMPRVTEYLYFKMISKKTASLIAASCYIGAILGEGNLPYQESRYCYRLGQAIGMTYQIRDDILGIWGKDIKTGKTVGDDILNKKRSLPIIYGLINSDRNRSKKLKQIYSQNSIGSTEVHHISRLLDELGAKKYSQETAEKYYFKAIALINSMKIDKKHKVELSGLAEFCLKREY